MFFLAIRLAFAESAGTLPAGSWVLYGGPAMTTYGHLQRPDGVVNVPDGFQTRLDLFGAAGLGERLQLAAYVPLVYSFSSGTSCKGGCEPVAGVGAAGVQARVAILKAPLLLTGALGVSSSAWLAPSRGRYTTVGEATTDLVPALYVGRDFDLGAAAVGLVAFGAYGFRVAAWESAVDEDVPFDDVRAGLEVKGTLGPVSVMAGAWTTQRLGGAAFTGDDPLFAAAFDTTERWAALDYDNVSAGGKVSIGLPANLGVHVGVARTVWSRNGPSDAMDVSLGVHKWFPPS